MKRITFSMRAWSKMIMLIESIDKEVAWNGTVTRNGDDHYIHDIFVYPQTVTGATVTVDDEQYTKWNIEMIKKGLFNKMHFHGHSHVNMCTLPSSTDMNMQADIVEQLRDDDFYIFGIFNKSLTRTLRLYEDGKVFNTRDIQISIDGLNYRDFCHEVKENVTYKGGKL